MVIRSQWRASTEEPGEGVTQLAAHGITDGKSFSQFWRAEDAGSIRSTAGLSNSMVEFDNRRTVTNGAQCGAAVSVHYPSGQGPDNLHYVETISRYEPELIFLSLIHI